MSLTDHFLDVFSVTYFRELEYGCYFKLGDSNHCFVSNNYDQLPDDSSNLKKFFRSPLVFCEAEETIPHGGIHLRVDQGDILYLAGALRLANNGGVQIIGGSVTPLQSPKSDEEYFQITETLRTAARAESRVEVPKLSCCFELHILLFCSFGLLRPVGSS
jgi:hypothetical protein